MTVGYIYPVWESFEVWNSEDIWWSEPIMPTILPDTAGEAELELEQLIRRFDALPDYIRPLWNVDQIPGTHLPWLAWAMSVDDWDTGWTDQTKREVIRQSVEVHRRKGTIGAIKRALVAAGYGDATVLERAGAGLYDGSLTYDGGETHSPGDHWAEYRVIMQRPITNNQADVVREILASVAPLRCHLKVLDFVEAAYLHDNTLTYNGAVNYGAA